MDERVVTILTQNGASSLVEWTQGGRQRRAWLPASLVDGGRCDTEELARGVPVGVDWEDFIVSCTPLDVANALRRRGIWTLQDLQARFAEAKSAAWEASQINLVGLLQRAQSHEEGQ